MFGVSHSDYITTRDLCIIYAPFALAWCFAFAGSLWMVIKQERKARELSDAMRKHPFNLRHPQQERK